MRQLGNLQTIYLIARREFVTRVRTRIFVIGTILIIVGLSGYIAFQLLVINNSAKNTQTYKVAFIGDATSLADQFVAAEKALGVTIKQESVSDQAQADSRILNGKLELLVSGSATSPQLTARNAVPTGLQAVLQSIVRQNALNAALASVGVNPATVEAKVASATVTVHTLNTSSSRIETVAAGFVVAVLLYVALLTYGTFIAQGVVEEKANRIVEILLSTVRPVQLLLGKVIGIGLVGLLQLSIIGVAGIVLTNITKVFTAPTLAVGVVLSGILWFVLGFFLYAVLFAAAGSLVSRSEEVQSAVIPITMLAIISYFVAISVITPMFDGSPMSTTGIILAMIPPFAPVIMPTGMASGDIPPALSVLSVVLTVITSAGATWLAARIYSNSVLRLGARVKITEALRSERSAS